MDLLFCGTFFHGMCRLSIRSTPSPVRCKHNESMVNAVMKYVTDEVARRGVLTASDNLHSVLIS